MEFTIVGDITGTETIASAEESASCRGCEALRKGQVAKAQRIC